MTSIRFYNRDPFSSKIVSPTARAALRRLIGRRLTMSSYGKHLVISAGSTCVTVHLGMTGQFRAAPVPRPYRRHHFMTLQWGKTACHFLDFRRFARIRAAKLDSPCALGGFHPREGFFLRPPAELRAQRTLMKGSPSTPRIAWLLQHGQRTGVGTYLANEALGHLSLSPFQPCETEEEAIRILRACQRLARESYRAGGTSFGIGYFRLDGSEGTFSRRLRYYQNPRTPRIAFRNRSVYSYFIKPSA